MVRAKGKSSKKTTITFSIDDTILRIIRKDSAREGISINSKINNILMRYALCYRYSEVQGGLIVPDNSVPIFLENIDEEKLKAGYRIINLDLVPSMLLENMLPVNLDNWIKYVCQGMLLYGGSFKNFSEFEDDEGRLNLVFRHNYGIKWSKVISEVYTEFLEKILHYHVQSTILSNSVALRIIEKNIRNLDGNCESKPYSGK